MTDAEILKSLSKIRKKDLTHRGTGGGGGVLRYFTVLQYFGNTLHLIDSPCCALQVKVNIMGCGAARGPRHYSKWPQ